MRQFFIINLSLILSQSTHTHTHTHTHTYSISSVSLENFDWNNEFRFPYLTELPDDTKNYLAMMRFQKSTMLLPSLKSEVSKREFFLLLSWYSSWALNVCFMLFFFNLLFIEPFLSLGSYSSLLYNLTAFFISVCFNRKCHRLDGLNNTCLFSIILEGG